MIACQISLECIDVAVPIIPHSTCHEPARQFLLLEQLPVHAHDEHLLVVGAIEYAAVAAGWQAPGGPPQVVVSSLVGAFNGCTTQPWG